MSRAAHFRPHGHLARPRLRDTSAEKSHPRQRDPLNLQTKIHERVGKNCDRRRGCYHRSNREAPPGNCTKKAPADKRTDSTNKNTADGYAQPLNNFEIGIVSFVPLAKQTNVCVSVQGKGALKCTIPKSYPGPIQYRIPCHEIYSSSIVGLDAFLRKPACQ